MTNKEIATLAATIAAGMLPVYISPGHAAPENLQTVATAAVDLARRIAVTAGVPLR